MVEFVLWGNPPGHDSTYGKALLCTGITSQEAAEKARDVLARDHGVTDITIQVINGARPVFGRNLLAR